MEGNPYSHLIMRYNLEHTITAQHTENDVRDDEYYFDNLVIFKVGNTLFRVPKHGFVVPGTVFEAMFSLPTTGDKMEGVTDQSPITLPVEKETFRGFLRAMYSCNLKGSHTINNEDWLAALDLSTVWMFHEMRNRAIKGLVPWIASQKAKEVILLAKKYRVITWLKDGYTRLLQQPSLTADELSAVPSLDWETISRLLSAKLNNQCGGACHDYVGRHYGDRYGCGLISKAPDPLLSAMEQEFQKEFSEMGTD